MLVLTMHKDEWLHIGDSVRMKLTPDCRMEQARVAIDAPKDVPVFRRKVEPGELDGLKNPHTR